MICERCEKFRTQIESRGINVVNRGRWGGRPTIRDEELLLAIQRRLWGQDHRALTEQQKVRCSWAKRVAEARERDEAELEVEEPIEPGFAEAAE